MIDFSKLAAPFPAEEVSWRLGSVSKAKMRGMALAYLDARNVMDRLDDVCGPGGWQCKYSHANSKTICDIGIWVGVDVANPNSLWEGWVWKADGAGDSDIEAEKGAMSDAFKRAGVRWGIGRYLYTLDSPWVEVEEIGQTGKFKIKQGAYKELDMILRRATQAILSGQQNQPTAIQQARNDIAQMQNAGEQPITEQKTHSRIAAEKFVNDTLDVWKDLNGVGLGDWNRTLYSKTKTNEQKVDELQDNHPDLYDKLQVAADEVRLRGNARAA